jgi:hypothetical protein
MRRHCFTVSFEDRGTAMDSQATLLTRAALLLIAALGMCALYWLPSRISYFLLIWTLASVPTGVLMGHCVLRDDPARSGPGHG